MTPAGPIPVILNPRSGPGHSKDEIAEVRAAFREAGAEIRVLLVAAGSDPGELAARAARERPPIVVAGGGDGTVSAVAAALAGTGIALGVLPLGTLNHFAKDLGLSLELQQAARDVVSGKSIAVDVGEVNGRVFVNNSSVGLYPQAVRYREQLRRRLGHGKWRAMFWAAMTVLRRYPFLDVRLKIGAEDRRCRTPFVFIGNNKYEMEGFSIGRRRRIDCGELSIYTTKPIGRLGLVKLALRALFGRLRQARDFEAMTAASARIESRRRRQMLVATDGEVSMMEMPVEYRIRPRSLKVIVPAAAASA